MANLPILLGRYIGKGVSTGVLYEEQMSYIGDKLPVWGNRR